MSSTQHQLIEQCATRLRGIVEALDNIHDNTPHRWSTDLDDVHSSAESLLALIKGQAPARSEASFEEWLANELEGEDGQPVPAAACDITLARRAFNHWPKLKQPAKVGGVRFSAGVSSRLVVEAAQRLYEFESTPEKEAERIDPEQESVEQAGGDERVIGWRERILAAHPNSDPGFWTDALLVEHMAAEIADLRAALAQPSPAQAEAERPEVVARVDGADEDWFIQPEDETEMHNEGLLFAGCELGRMVDFDHIAGALRADRDSWAEQAEQRLADWDEMRKERDAALARVAELEQSQGAEVFLTLTGEITRLKEKLAELGGQSGIEFVYDSDELVAVPRGLLGAACHAIDKKRDAPRTIAKLREYARGLPAPVAQAQQLNDLDKQCRDDVARALGLRPNQERGFAWSYLLASIKSCVKASGDSAQAQHSVPDVCDSKEQNAFEEWASKEGMNMECHPLHWLFLDAKTYSARQGWKAALKYARNILAAAPGKEVPQAWLDVQAERRRQVEAEGWTPEHDDQHSHGQMARAAACYALAGSSAPNDGTAALLVSLAWPWDQQWWKPTSARRDLVKACALALAEIERLDRATATQGGPRDA
ncbi:hypothetical protein MX655_10660 [Pseudomonas aeruginosa]|uniref:hypothetical protein n=1 Tax=Pseudomonas aeruginosa TaxID=287 RepID=UPI001FF71483|nr:hypothetical protein [Pseudomonas aeruginosa]MCK1826001.1 hypothetical protein [Pseudomonas aeruginosa]